ncbi:MAG: hypothetical protein MK080_07835 [Opitutales bacterium]|nr:hypothetical protein [Opitutales bacterium]NRA26541.1 hypothetical protein [Opitutales bacterium]
MFVVSVLSVTADFSTAFGVGALDVGLGGGGAEGGFESGTKLGGGGGTIVGGSGASAFAKSPVNTDGPAMSEPNKM